MNPNDITAIELALGFSVPPSYRKVLVERFDSVPRECVGYEFASHRELIVSQNVAARAHLMFGRNWPDEMLIIGGDGAGGVFCIDRRMADPPVVYFDHEDHSFRPVATSVCSWIQQLIDEYKPA